MQRAPLFAGSVLVAATMLAACGGGGGGGTPPTVTSPGTTAPVATPTPTVAPQSTNPPSMPTMATINSTAVWVGQNGHTLYVFGADTANTSNCSSASGCTGVWPPYAAPAGTTAPAGSGFGIITRSDGTLQWTIGTQPLYEYSGDSASGTINGNGITSFGGTWSDAVATASPASTPTPSGYIRIRP